MKQRGVDVVAVALGVLLFLEGIGLLLGQRVYGQMFKDFGGSLPFLTRLYLLPFPLLVNLIVVAVTVEGVIRQRSESAMVARVVVELIVGVLMLVGFIAGMYLPIFTLSGAIAP